MEFNPNDIQVYPGIENSDLIINESDVLELKKVFFEIMLEINSILKK